MVYLRSAAELHQGIMDAKEKELQNQCDSLNRDVSVSQYQIQFRNSLNTNRCCFCFRLPLVELLV